jgi:hypothetical protein
MRFAQADLFAQDDAARNSLSQAQRATIRARLEATLARLEATATFPWRDPLDAVHEENRFQRETDALGEEGKPLWARFDKEMDRLHATQAVAEGETDRPSH